MPDLRRLPSNSEKAAPDNALISGDDFSFLACDTSLDMGHPIDYYRNSITDSDSTPVMENEFFSGFIRLHILHHAAEAPIFGFGILEELGRHGYKLSPGTLYPILHRMEERGLLASQKELVAGKFRRVYRITEAGSVALREAKEKVRELFGELFSQEKPQ